MKHQQNFTPDRVPTIEVLTPTARFSLRAREQHREILSDALRVDLSKTIGERRRADAREVLCLGPDEWLIVADAAEATEIATSGAKIYEAAPHALANISDREIGMRISGPCTLDLLAMGCPHDIAAVQAGRGLRTVFDGVTAVIWRDGVQDFRIDVWRSFAPQVRDLLETGRAELFAGL